MDDDGGSPKFRKRGMKDRTSYLITGIGIGMLIALVADSLLLGLCGGILIGLGMEALASKGFRLFQTRRRLEENSLSNH